MGDYLAYRIGANILSDRISMLQRTKDQAALQFTQRTFRTRGSALVLSGRFIPVGRTVVNMSAGAVGFPLRRFIPLAAVAGVLWAGMAAAMGVVAAHVFDEHPLLAIVAGIVVGMGIGLVIDSLVQRRRKRRGDMTS